MAYENSVGRWNAYARRYPLPDPWWPLQWKEPSAAGSAYVDVSRTHPAVFGVWRELDGTYTVAMKAEAARAGKPFKDTMEVKRRHVPDLLTLRTLLITLAKP